MSHRSLARGLAAALTAAVVLQARPVAAWETATHVGLYDAVTGGRHQIDLKSFRANQN